MPFVRVSQDKSVIVWVKKEYRPVEGAFPPGTYRFEDRIYRSGIRHIGATPTSGVEYDPEATRRKVAAFYSASPDDFEFVSLTPDLEQVAKNFTMLIDSARKCPEGMGAPCVDAPRLRGLGGVIKGI